MRQAQTTILMTFIRISFWISLFFLLLNCNNEDKKNIWIVKSDNIEFKLPDYNFAIVEVAFLNDSLVELNPTTNISKVLKYKFDSENLYLFYSDFQYSLKLIKKNEEQILIKSKYLEKEKLINYSNENDLLSKNGYLVLFIKKK